MPDQIIAIDDSFETFDLDNYANDLDGDTLVWQSSGNTGLDVQINSENIVTINHPQGWSGEENITFTVSDGWVTASVTAKFTVFSCNFGEYQAEYFDNKSLQGDPIATECVSGIDYDWGINAPEQLLNNGNIDNFSIRWSTISDIRPGE